MRLKSVIVDDEPKSVRLLQGYLADFDSVEVVDVCYNAQDAYVLINQYKPDLLFLDISMPGENAFDLLNRFKRRDFEVIFTTAYDQYALKAFEEHALHYLLKPIDQSKLEKALEHCVQLLESKIQGTKEPAEEKKEPLKIQVPAHNGYALLDIEKIVRCEGEGNYTKIYMNDAKTYLVSQSIKAFEDKLGAYCNSFFRIHKQHLVNIAYINGFSRGKGGEVTLANGKILPISFRKKSEFVQFIQLFKQHKV